MKKVRTLSILDTLALGVHVSLAYATQIKLLNVMDVGQVSNRYSSILTPAPITFAIWGIIYIALAAFCIYHIFIAFVSSPERPANTDIRRIGIWFILNNLGAAGWLLVWTHELIAASVLLIFFQLITLVIIHARLHIYSRKRSLGSKIFTQVPLSIYLGWITVATIANTAAYISLIGWDRLGFHYSPVTWARITIGLLTFITVLVVLLRKNIYFGLTILWALYGILARLDPDPAMYDDVIQTIWIAMAVVLFICVIQLLRNSIRKKEIYPPFPQAPASLK